MAFVDKSSTNSSRKSTIKELSLNSNLLNKLRRTKQKYFKGRQSKASSVEVVPPNLSHEINTIDIDAGVHSDCEDHPYYKECLPRLIIEPSSDQEDNQVNSDDSSTHQKSKQNQNQYEIIENKSEIQTQSSNKFESDNYNLEVYSMMYSNKPRSLSYCNEETVNEMSFLKPPSSSDLDLQLSKENCRPRGRSMEIPKPCIHCILLQELANEKSKLSSHSSSREMDSDIIREEEEVDDEEEEEEEECNDKKEISNKEAPVSTIYECHSLEMNKETGRNNFLQVPTAYTLAHLENNLKPRSKSIGAALEFLESEGKFSDFIKTIPNKPRAVSIDFNLISTTHDHLMDIHSSSSDAIKIINKRKSNLSVDTGRPRINSNTSNKGLSADNISGLDKPTADWTFEAQNKLHFWIDCNHSGDLCYLSDQECERNGPKKKCVSCKIMVHTLCTTKLTLECRPTFREAGVRDYRDDMKKENLMTHHWVHRKRQEGKCRLCNKSFQNKLRFNIKEVIAVQCTWCKAAYHNRPTCFAPSLLTEACSRGQHFDSIIPPAWIIKMPTKNTFKSSVRKSRSPDPPNRLLLVHQISMGDSDNPPAKLSSPIKEHFIDPAQPKHLSTDDVTLSKTANHNLSALSAIPTSTTMTKSISLQSNIWLNSIPFVIKPIPNTAPSKPLLVYVNPKSGGNDGIKLLRKFQWLLNPRQVFDISDKGPRLGLELFARINNLRILVCGGDGTAGWVMSEIDKLRISTIPPIAILPLGTGNDLARTTNWGGGYKDESLSKILSLVEEGTVKPLDRWDLISQPHYSNTSNTNSESHDSQLSADYHSPTASSTLPLNVFNNYFSLGLDAAATLGFHESREANPEKFNSRIKNKIFYAGVGGREIIKGSWKDLSEYVTIICDDIDYTPRLKELKPLALLFLNIPRYSAGTLPWGHPSSGYSPQSFSDGKLEVMGFTATSVATVQVGGHADRICQCSTVVMTTTKAIPIQVDGEPCRLLPSQIKISLRNSFQIIMRPKRRSSVTAMSDEESTTINEINRSMNMSVFIIPFADYEDNAMDRTKILESARFYGMLKEKGGATLANAREKILTIKSDLCTIDEDFTFIDSTTSERFFRIDRSKEVSHFLMDICDDDLYVLDPKLDSIIAGGDQKEEMQIELEKPYQEPKTNDGSEVDEIDNAIEVVELDEISIAKQENGISNTQLMMGDLEEDNDDDDDTKRLNTNGEIMLMVNEEVKLDDINTDSDVDGVGGEMEDVENYNVEIVDNTDDDNNGQCLIEPKSILKYDNAEQLDTVFLDACKSNSIDKIESIVLDGANMLATDSYGRSGLHLATINKNLAAVHFLIHNAPVELLKIQDSVKNQTALHVAAELGRRSICSLLVSAGVPLLCRDCDGKLASELTADENLMHYLQSKSRSAAVVTIM